MFIKTGYIKNTDGICEDIILLSDDEKFLEQKRDVLYQYTKNTYPLVSCEKPAVEYCLSSEFRQQGFLYQIKLKKLLPPNVYMLMDLTQPQYSSGYLPRTNCYGSTMMLAGIFPCILASSLYEFQNSLLSVKIKNIRPGDIVKFSVDHSILYLDNDICFSKNGFDAPLMIYSVAEILKLYSTVIDDHVAIYRKTPTQQYENSFMDALVNYYYALVASEYASIRSACYEHYKESLKSLYRQINTKQKENIYVAMTGHVSVGLLREITVEVDAEETASFQIKQRRLG